MQQCFDLPHSICPLYEKTFVGEVIMMDSNRIFKVPDHDFGEFHQLICIYMFVTENPGTN